VGLVMLLSAAGDSGACGQCLAAIAQKVQTGELAGPGLVAVRDKLQPFLKERMGKGDGVAFEATLLAATLRDPAGLDAARKAFAASVQNETLRLKALSALVTGGDPAVLDEVAQVLDDPRVTSPKFRGQVLAALGKLDEPKVAAVVLRRYSKMEPDLQPK